MNFGKINPCVPVQKFPHWYSVLIISYIYMLFILLILPHYDSSSPQNDRIPKLDPGSPSVETSELEHKDLFFQNSCTPNYFVGLHVN